MVTNVFATPTKAKGKQQQQQQQLKKLKKFMQQVSATMLAIKMAVTS